MLQVEDDVRDAVRSWEKENNRPFLVEGVKYDMYIIRQREAYNEQKIREKEQRVGQLRHEPLDE